MNPKISFIYVHYNTPDLIERSIKSIPQAVGKLSYEVIIVDNGSEKKISLSLAINVVVIENHENIGYGKALNVGVEKAKGDLLVLVNSDTKFKPSAIKYLHESFNDPTVGVAGPKFLDKQEITIKSNSGLPFLPGGMIAFSFFNKIWPTNSYSKKYWLYNFDYEKKQETESLCGACLMVKKNVFDKIDGFDERFFMYFEESDFCYRLRKAGYKAIYNPKSEIIHFVGKSNENREKTQKIFEKSRFNFFRKYHGLFLALTAELFLRLTTLTNFLLGVIVLLSFFLNTYKLNDLMIFIGDQGWFYLSARDIILGKNIPLVGITSSHTWLHQGPLWTYFLALLLLMSNFNPVFPGYIVALIGTFSVFVLFKLTSELFNNKVGLVSSLLYATSPVVIIHNRMPYHTSFIPLLVILYIYFLYKWAKGSVNFFVLLILCLSVLYNFELATSVLWIIFILIFLYGFLNRKVWARAIFTKKTIMGSIFAFILPMLPIIIYDFSNGFNQTFKFSGWVVYKIFSLFININNQVSFFDTIGKMTSYFWDFYRNLIFPVNNLFAIIIAVISCAIIINFLLKPKQNEIKLLVFVVVIVLISYVLNQTPSQAYLPVLYPLIIILVAWGFVAVMKNRFFTIIVCLIIFLICLLNINFLISNNYLMEEKYTFKNRFNLAQETIKLIGNKRYNLIGKGIGSQFESYTMNYEYLLWWLGKAPSKDKEKIKIILKEEEQKIKLELHRAVN